MDWLPTGLRLLRAMGADCWHEERDYFLVLPTTELSGYSPGVAKYIDACLFKILPFVGFGWELRVEKERFWRCHVAA